MQAGTQGGRSRPIDRVAAITAPAVLGLVLALLAAFTRAPLRADPVAEAAAARDLVALLRHGEQQSYVVQYRFERVRADGRRLPADAYEARDRAVFVTRSGTTLRIEGNDASYDCELATGKPSCYAGPASHALPFSAVFDTAIHAGPYDVRAAGSTTIAGEPARCFTVRARSPEHVLPDVVGYESHLCVAADGVILQRQVLGEVLDQWTAAWVVRRFDTASLKPVVAGFERAALALGR